MSKPAQIKYNLACFFVQIFRGKYSKAKFHFSGILRAFN